MSGVKAARSCAEAKRDGGCRKYLLLVELNHIHSIADYVHGIHAFGFLDFLSLEHDIYVIDKR